MTEKITLARVVRRVESTDGLGVMRFEFACYQAIVGGKATAYCTDPFGVVQTIMQANHCSRDTACMIFATSWGEYQDMGFEIYGELFHVLDNIPSIPLWLSSKDMQDAAFMRWCRVHGTSEWNDGLVDVGTLSTEDLRSFARAYNGPGNIDPYVRKMWGAFAELTGSRMTTP